MSMPVSEDELSVPLLVSDHDSDDELVDHLPRSERPHSWTPDSAQSLQKRTPLPLAQLVILSAVRLAEPIAYTQIFPYINQMMEDMKVTDKPSEIGYYSGTVDSVFAICQLFTIFQWGKLSDRIGRKPVILLGLAGVALSTTLFGFSKSLLWAVVSRSMAGALSGNVAVVQSVIGEITDETNQGQAYPLSGLSWSLGCIIGPMIGGNFVNPAKTYPNTFGNIQLLIDYPYLLPCLVSACVTICAIVMGVFYLKETLPSKVRLDPSLPSPISAQAHEKFPVKEDDISVRQILSSDLIRSIFKNYFLLSILGTGFDVVFILLAYTPVRLGGLSRNPEEIGYALAFSGMAGAVIQVFVFPPLQRRYNNITLYRFLMSFWPLVYGLLPFLNVIARWTMPVLEATDLDAMDDAQFPAGPVMWFSIGVLLSLLRFAVMSFSLNVILVKNASPSQKALGSTFGLAQSVACIARSGAPAFVSSLFAVSKKYQILGGNFVWLVMFCVACLAVWSTFQLHDGSVRRDAQLGADRESDMMQMRAL